jgi:glutathione synthase
MMLAAQSKGWTIYFLQQSDLFIQEGVVQGNFKKLALTEALVDWYSMTGEHTAPLVTMDAVLMRKNPHSIWSSFTQPICSKWQKKTD